MIGRLFQVSGGYSTTALVDERRRGTVAVWLAARPATVVSHNDGSIAADGNDTTVLGVVADDFDGLAGMKTWADAHRAEALSLITAAGTPLAVRDTDAASLRSSVESRPELEPLVLAPLPAGSLQRFEWFYDGLALGPRPLRTQAQPA
jgi:hypothetical protein